MILWKRAFLYCLWQYNVQKLHFELPPLAYQPVPSKRLYFPQLDAHLRPPFLSHLSPTTWMAIWFLRLCGIQFLFSPPGHLALNQMLRSRSKLSLKTYYRPGPGRAKFWPSNHVSLIASRYLTTVSTKIKLSIPRHGYISIHE